MAKSMRSKRKKRLRTIRREIAEPFYEKQEAAKQAAQEAALAAPKLPVRTPNADAMAEDPAPPSAAAVGDDPAPSSAAAAAMDVEMADRGSLNAGDSKSLLKAVGGVGKKSKRKLAKGKRHGKGKGKGKGKIRRKRI